MGLQRQDSSVFVVVVVIVLFCFYTVTSEQLGTPGLPFTVGRGHAAVRKVFVCLFVFGRVPCSRSKSRGFNTLERR